MYAFSFIYCRCDGCGKPYPDDKLYRYKCVDKKIHYYNHCRQCALKITTCTKHTPPVPLKQ